MKKVIGLVLVFLLLAGLVGCSSEQKSEEELKAEIKAEMEADAKLKEELKEEIKEEMAKEQGQDNANGTKPEVAKIDMKDIDALYEFINKEVVDIERKNFDAFPLFYCDITGDGTDEAVFVANRSFHTNVEIISGDSGQYRIIPADIPLAKYETTASFEDGFLAVTGTTGGTGVYSVFMDLYKFNGSEMANVLGGLLISEEVAPYPDVNYNMSGNIDGRLNDFTYTLSKYDNNTGQETIEVQKKYTYNANAIEFDVETFQAQDVSASRGEDSQSETDSEESYGDDSYDAIPYFLSSLNNGDSVLDLIIKDIDYSKSAGKASFTLAGTTSLIGQVYFDNMWNIFMLKVSDESNLPSILVEGPDDSFTYKPDYIGFRNENDLLKAIFEEKLEEVRNGAPMDVEITIKDIKASMKFGSESATSCEFIDLKTL